jgi:Rho-binding antiterminator
LRLCERIIKYMQQYQNISCSYYDRLEAYATKRTECVIVYNDGEEKNETGVIADLFAREGAEYLKLNSGTVIRLDHLVSINGFQVNTPSAGNVC